MGQLRIFELCAGLDVKFMNAGMAFRFMTASVNTASGNNGDIRSQGNGQQVPEGGSLEPCRMLKSINNAGVGAFIDGKMADIFTAKHDFSAFLDHHLQNLQIVEALIQEVNVVRKISRQGCPVKYGVLVKFDPFASYVYSAKD
jgi:hypothetical protein